jgi:amino acid transporter
MVANQKRSGFAGWVALMVTGTILGVFGTHGFSAKNHNGFFIALLLISMGIVLFFGTFYARDQREENQEPMANGPSQEY